MTRVFNENGDHVPVTVLRLIPNTIVQKKSVEKDGYESIKVGYDFKKLKNLNKPKIGELKALGDSEKLPSKFTELPSIESAEVGGVLSAELFTKGSLISVTSSSKGKGFAGVMKRYGFAGGPAAHGSKFHRTTGSIGNRATPGKVWKGKKMPGHMGCETKTIKNLKIEELNIEMGYLLVKGSVPGHKNSFVEIKLLNKGE